LRTFAAKKAVYQNRPAGDSIADFSKAEPVQRELAATAAVTDWADWTGRARQISGVFLSRPDILTSEINVVEDRGRRYFLNSEGFRFAIPLGLAGVRVVAEAQTAGGVMARDVIELFETGLADMPPAADLVARTRDLAARMEVVRAAKAGDEYSGPVLFEGRAGAELIGQVLVPALVAVRGPDSDNAALERAAQNMASPFLSRIGSRVMTEDLSVRDTPSLAKFAGRNVPGAYELDDEGVPAKDVDLIEKGRLVTLLTSRVPQRNLPQSNGHGRGGSAQGGVVQVSSSSAVAGAKLKASYLELLRTQGKPFGYIVRSVIAPGALVTSGDVNDLISTLNIGGPGGPLVPQIVKVTPDGAEEVVRSMRLGALTPNIFRDVLGVSEERVMLTQRGAATGFAAPGALGGRQVPISVIAPGLIIDNIEVQRLRENAQKPPVVPSPLIR
jgi:TldD protein